MALVLGIYERLVAAIHGGAAALGALLRGRPGDAWRRFRAIEWPFLLALLAGIGLAVVSLAALIDRLLEEQPRHTAAVFFGLVAGSVLIAWRLVGRWTPGRVTLLAAVAGSAFFLLGLRSAPVADPALVVFLGAGMTAIVAMILPGISGSFLLVTMGMYGPVLAAVNRRDLLVLALFAAGCVVGLAAFSRLLAWLITNHHDPVVAAMIGLMLGSVRVLWPWPGGTATTELTAPAGDVVVPLLLAAAGLVAVVLLGRLGALKEEPVPHPG